MLERSGKSCVGVAWAVGRVDDCAWAMEGFAGSRDGFRPSVLALGSQAAEMSVVL